MSTALFRSGDWPQEKAMNDSPVTFQAAIDGFRQLADYGCDERASYLFDLVDQAVDGYIVSRGRWQETLAGKSLGKKIAVLDNEKDEDLKSAVKRFRSLRLKILKSPRFTDEMIAGLKSAAAKVVSTAGAEERTFSCRVPLGSKIVNSVSIETIGGFRYFHILHADVFSVPADLTVISTHANATEPPSGQLVSALKKRGIEIDPEKVFQIIENGSTWTCFQPVQGYENVHAILTARIKASRGRDDPTEFFDRAVKGIFTSLAALEYLGHRFQTVNMPVIYGQRIVDYQGAIRSLVQNSLTWLKKSDHTECINFVVYSSDELEQWNTALNSCLGRSMIAAGSNEVLAGMTHEVIIELEALPDSSINTALEPLRRALSARDKICVQSVCIFGRKMCELVCCQLLEKQSLKASNDLCSNIERLRESKIAAPWICSYMHSLRIFGNETVHERSEVKYLPRTLGQNDLLAALTAVRAVLAFWRLVSTGQNGDRG